MSKPWFLYVQYEEAFFLIFNFIFCIYFLIFSIVNVNVRAEIVSNFKILYLEFWCKVAEFAAHVQNEIESILSL